MHRASLFNANNGDSGVRMMVTREMRVVDEGKPWTARSTMMGARGDDDSTASWALLQ